LRFAKSAFLPQNIQMILSASAIDPLPKISGTLKRHNLPRSQHHVLTSGRVSASTFMLFVHTEFTETRDKDILTGLHRGLYEFKEGLNNVDSFFLGGAKF
jgi:hypothetical protein